MESFGKSILGAILVLLWLVFVVNQNPTRWFWAMVTMGISELHRAFDDDDKKKKCRELDEKENALLCG